MDTQHRTDPWGYGGQQNSTFLEQTTGQLYLVKKHRIRRCSSNGREYSNTYGLAEEWDDEARLSSESITEITNNQRTYRKKSRWLATRLRKHIYWCTGWCSSRRRWYHSPLRYHRRQSGCRAPGERPASRQRYPAPGGCRWAEECAWESSHRHLPPNGQAMCEFLYSVLVSNSSFVDPIEHRSIAPENTFRNNRKEVYRFIEKEKYKNIIFLLLPQNFHPWLCIGANFDQTKQCHVISITWKKKVTKS